MNITVKKEITRETLECIFVTAIEGGSNYWYFIPEHSIKKIRAAVPKTEDPCLSTALFKAVYDMKIDIDIHDVEEEDECLGTISMSTMGERLQKIANDDNMISYLISEIEENGDAESSDVIFQYIVLGEVIYG